MGGAPARASSSWVRRSASRCTWDPATSRTSSTLNRMASASGTARTAGEVDQHEVEGAAKILEQSLRGARAEQRGRIIDRPPGREEREPGDARDSGGAEVVGPGGPVRLPVDQLVGPAAGRRQDARGDAELQRAGEGAAVARMADGGCEVRAAHLAALAAERVSDAPQQAGLGRLPRWSCDPRSASSSPGSPTGRHPGRARPARRRTRAAAARGDRRRRGPPSGRTAPGSGPGSRRPWSCPRRNRRS